MTRMLPACHWTDATSKARSTYCTVDTEALPTATDIASAEADDTTTKSHLSGTPCFLDLVLGTHTTQGDMVRSGDVETAVQAVVPVEVLQRRPCQPSPSSSCPVANATEAGLTSSLPNPEATVSTLANPSLPSPRSSSYELPAPHQQGVKVAVPSNMSNAYGVMAKHCLDLRHALPKDDALTPGNLGYSGSDQSANCSLYSCNSSLAADVSPATPSQQSMHTCQLVYDGAASTLNLPETCGVPPPEDGALMSMPSLCTLGQAGACAVPSEDQEGPTSAVMGAGSEACKQ